jgi:beta-N-acetylhexosaminidase
MRAFNVFLSLSLLLAGPLLGAGPWPASAQTQIETAQEILTQMTAEERIGQLFLVTFQGSSAPSESAINTLIRQHHVAGVVLRADNDNFVAAPNTALAVRELAVSLQAIEYDSSLTGNVLDAAGAEQRPSYIPLFVGVSDEESETPIHQFIYGMSPFPPQMAIGATWNPELAEQVGQGLGAELRSLGINLYLGPSLDVLEEPGQAGPGDLGTRTFGGDPYWVSEMGMAYVRGLHEGAEGSLAVIAKHFPGHGGSDRPLAEEVSTVRKSLDQLLQIELPPFFAVTSAAPGSDAGIVDGLLVSHIRYQGFQGNIRATTRPISLDPDAYGQLMGLEPLLGWRQAGGLTVSDSLGSRAIRRFRDPLEQTFQPQLVARDALVAGNDLLYLGSIRDPADPDELTSIQNTLAFFIQKYREDPVFAQRVDDAVLRTLQAKLRFYDGAFVRSRVTPPSVALEILGTNADVAVSVFRRGVTLISPSQEEVSDRLGGAPALSQRVVFFTDVKPLYRCSTCAWQTAMQVDALERRVNNLYGPGASGQVGTWNMWSFTTADLASYLGHPPTSLPATPLTSAEVIDEPIRTADWLIFSILDPTSARYGADALAVLLNERPDLVRDKRVVVFGFDVPYGLDATDLSKIDVYYSLFGASDPAVDIAARLLFEELTAPGASPVSVPGIGYDLISALQPDPAERISLSIEPVVGEGTPAPDVESGFTQGSLVRIRTGIIIDSNGFTVPDQTPVEFEVFQQTENIRQTISAVTNDGVAEITFRLDRLGLFIIQARSDPALQSDVLQLNVQEGVPAFPTVIAPSPFPSETVEPTQTPDLLTPTPEGGGGSASAPGGSAGIGWFDLVLGLLGVGLVAGGSYVYVGRSERWLGSQQRCALVAAVGGLVVYNYLALGLPGASGVMGMLGNASGLLAGLLGGLIGLGVYAGYRLALLRAPLEDGGHGGDDDQ